MASVGSGMGTGKNTGGKGREDNNRQRQEHGQHRTSFLCPKTRAYCTTGLIVPCSVHRVISRRLLIDSSPKVNYPERAKKSPKQGEAINAKCTSSCTFWTIGSPDDRFGACSLFLCYYVFRLVSRNIILFRYWGDDDQPCTRIHDCGIVLLIGSLHHVQMTPSMYTRTRSRKYSAWRPRELKLSTNLGWKKKINTPRFCAYCSARDIEVDLPWLSTSMVRCCRVVTTVLPILLDPKCNPNRNHNPKS